MTTQHNTTTTASQRTTGPGTGYRTVLDDQSKQVVRRNGAPLGRTIIDTFLIIPLIFTCSIPLRPWNYVLSFLLLLWTIYTIRARVVPSYDVAQTSRGKTIAGYIAIYAVIFATLSLLSCDEATLVFNLAASVGLGILCFIIGRYLFPSNYIEPVD